ncbi:MAG: hypothetical protein MUD01_10935 [Chloroflexaceae bacterium]|nr:hypothetical protein [Chloroflexaceae bacterium]
MGVHTRRLLRLSQVIPVETRYGVYLRQRAKRMWVMLGRPEFWRATHSDVLMCIQLTFMLFLFVWGISR